MISSGGLFLDDCSVGDSTALRTALFSFQSFGYSCCLVKIYCYLCKIPMCTIVSIYSIISHAFCVNV